jgi:hypothetical protein
MGTLTSWNPLGHSKACNGTALPLHLFVWDNAAELEDTAKSIIMRKWKWYFVDGCKCKRLTSTGTTFLNFCQDGTSALTYLGIMMQNNDTYRSADKSLARPDLKTN